MERTYKFSRINDVLKSVRKELRVIEDEIWGRAENNNNVEESGVFFGDYCELAAEGKTKADGKRIKILQGQEDRLIKFRQCYVFSRILDGINPRAYFSGNQ